MSKILVFGGPALQPGQVTWYITRRSGYEEQVHVRPREEVRASEVEGADSYVQRGLATWKTPGRTDPDEE